MDMDINRNIMYMRGRSGVGIISMSGLLLEQCSIHIITLMDLSRKYRNQNKMKNVSLFKCSLPTIRRRSQYFAISYTYEKFASYVSIGVSFMIWYVWVSVYARGVEGKGGFRKMHVCGRDGVGGPWRRTSDRWLDIFLAGPASLPLIPANPFPENCPPPNICLSSHKH